jgi:hypothetical protein
MEHTTIAVDLAKSVFQVAISHRAGRVDTCGLHTLGAPNVVATFTTGC